VTADLIRVRVQLPQGGPEQFARFGPGWHDLWIREGTSDEQVLDEIYVNDVYRVRSLDLTPVHHVDPYGDRAPWDEGRSVIDLGACTGIFSALCLAFGASHVIAVEPEPDNCALLRKNLGGYGDRVTIIEGAVSGDGEPVFIVGEAGTGHTERVHHGPPPHAVPSSTLAQIIDLAPTPIALCKIDVEGAEYDAIAACDSEHLARVENLALEVHGPATAAHLDPATIDAQYGALLTKLAYTHAVTAFGTPDAGGYVYAHRYPS
jgi:FkbM family methyltransferase